MQPRRLRRGETREGGSEVAAKAAKLRNQNAAKAARVEAPAFMRGSERLQAERQASHIATAL